MGKKQVKNILAIEDSTVFQKLIEKALPSYNVLKALDTPEGEALLKNEAVDLILLDVNLPTENGFDFCQRIKKLNEFKNIPVIFLTGSEGAENVVKGLTVGGSDYLLKPFAPEELICRVDNQLTIVDLTKQLVKKGQTDTLKSMVATYNHELNNPLTIAMFNFHKLVKSADLDETVVKKVNDALERLGETVKKIRELTEVVETDYSEQEKMIDIHGKEESKAEDKDEQKKAS